MGRKDCKLRAQKNIHHIVGTVDAHQPCIDAAIAREVDLLLVHHGIFWGGPKRLAGSYGRLVRSFFDNNINLYAAHLALDAHPELGNNAELARRLGMEIVDWWATVKGVDIGVIAEPPVGIKLDYLVNHFEQTVGTGQGCFISRSAHCP